MVLRDRWRATGRDPRTKLLKSGRPTWWLVLALLFVLGLIYYLGEFQ